MQFGSGWWFTIRSTMERQMTELAQRQLGLLSRFVGTLTDSRSFRPHTVTNTSRRNSWCQHD